MKILLKIYMLRTKKILRILKYFFLGFFVILIALFIYFAIAVQLSEPEINDTSILDTPLQSSSEDFVICGKGRLQHNKYGLWELYLEGNPFELGVINGKLTKELIEKQEIAFVNQINKMIPSRSYLNFLKYFIAFFNRNLDNNIGILKLFPGVNEATVKSIVNTVGMKALILETFGSGNAPTDKWFLNILEYAIKNGLIILNVTQCKSGSVEIGLYETSVELGKIGVIGGKDITTESAITKQMYFLGEGYSNDKIKHLLNKSIRGEMTE